jgi:hypothetical protein
MVRDGHDDLSNARATVVVSAHWTDTTGEDAFVIRSLAGAASRRGPVSVLVGGDTGGPDGAFDLQGLGKPPRWPTGLDAGCPVLVDQLTTEMAAVLHGAGRRPVHFLTAGGGEPDAAWQWLRVAGDGGIGLYVPINSLAERARHHGFGFTDYHLVLSAGTTSEVAPAEVAALSETFPEDDVVVVEAAVASAWRAGTLRGQVHVDTRMDLWRLLAHAKLCVDTGPGHLLARECIESLRFGTPVVVPAGSSSAANLSPAGVRTYGDIGELVEAAGALRDAAARSEASGRGRRYADAHHGDPAAMVARLSQVLAGP